MTSVLALAVACVVLLLAGLHTLWGFGSTWPEADERALARRVAGFRGVSRMPRPRFCFFVAALLVAMGGLALAGAGLIPSPLPPYSLRGALAGMAGVLLLRGGGANSARWRAMTPEEPFATEDRRHYGPPCIAIGAAPLCV